jgi:hypothetical protein
MSHEPRTRHHHHRGDRCGMTTEAMTGQPDTSAEAVERLAALMDDTAARGDCAGPPLCRWIAATLRALAAERDAALAARDEAIREMSRQAREAGAMEAQRDAVRDRARRLHEILSKLLAENMWNEDHPDVIAARAALGDTP